MNKIVVTQLNKNNIKSTFVGVIKYSILEKLVRLTARDEVGGGKENFFQRITDHKKVIKIVKFIEKKIIIEKKISLSLFPTSMILSFDIDDEYKNNIILKDDNLFSIPDNCENELLVVDGQHRFIGVREFYKKHPEMLEKIDIEFPATFLIGYDLYEQAKIFANVNFEQKTVSRDLYYDIFGSLPDVKDEMTLAHFTVKKMNEDEDSPLKDMIKMLGIGDGIISQSYFFKELMLLFSANKVFGVYFTRYKEETSDDYKKIPILLKIYFNIIFNEFNKYWPQKNKDGIYKQREYNDVLLKTTGLGALIKLFNYLVSDYLYLENNEIEDKIKIEIKKINKIEAEKFFSKNGDYGKSGGLQNKLFNEIKNLLEYKKVVDKETKDKRLITDIQKNI